MTADRLALPTDTDAQRCLKCGEDALDTGWECTECGYDNMPWYYPQGVKKEPTK
jgi:ribosomal protein L37E